MRMPARFAEKKDTIGTPHFANGVGAGCDTAPANGTCFPKRNKTCPLVGMKKNEKTLAIVGAAFFMAVATAIGTLIRRL